MLEEADTSCFIKEHFHDAQKTLRGYVIKRRTGAKKTKRHHNYGVFHRHKSENFQSFDKNHEALQSRGTPLHLTTGRHRDCGGLTVPKGKILHVCTNVSWRPKQITRLDTQNRLILQNICIFGRSRGKSPNRTWLWVQNVKCRVVCTLCHRIVRAINWTTEMSRSIDDDVEYPPRKAKNVRTLVVTIRGICFGKSVNICSGTRVRGTAFRDHLIGWKKTTWWPQKRIWDGNNGVWLKRRPE